VRAVLFVAVLLLASGCLAAKPPSPHGDLPSSPLTLEQIRSRLSQPLYGDVVWAQNDVPGADGVPVYVEVYRPRDAPGPVPTLLTFTPYQSFALLDRDPKNPLASAPYDGRLADYYVARGYAVAFADVRGNHNSGGCVDQTGPKQWEDGYHVVEWLAAQPWSNGRVGMHGISYDGETQISTALLNPPHLVTIVPAASVSNQYDYLYYDGVPYTLQGVGTMAGYAAISALPGDQPSSLARYPERAQCQVENFQAGADLSGDWNDYWDARDYRKGAHQINASILQIHGLQDWNVKPNHVDPIFNAYTSEKRLVLGQWRHAYPDRPDWQLILHRWYDHFLLDVDTGILQDLPPVLIEDDTGAWRSLESFPPLQPPTLTLYPTAYGVLAPQPPAPSSALLHDYARDPVVGGAAFANLGAEAGRTAFGHPHQLVFETPAFEEDVHLTGRPLLHLTAATGAKSTHWVVHLVEVDASGAAFVTNRGYLDTRHRDGVHQPKDLEPGQDVTLTIRLFPQDDVIQKGHRLRVVLTNDDEWVHQDTTYAVSTVRFGPDATRLELPLSPPGEPVPEDGLRPDLREPKA
jgi:X-Pro dipeptidyl-peptidase